MRVLRHHLRPQLNSSSDKKGDSSAVSTPSGSLQGSVKPKRKSEVPSSSSSPAPGSKKSKAKKKDVADVFTSDGSPPTEEVITPPKEAKPSPARPAKVAHEKAAAVKEEGKKAVQKEASAPRKKAHARSKPTIIIAAPIRPSHAPQPSSIAEAKSASASPVKPVREESKAHASERVAVAPAAVEKGKKRKAAAEVHPIAEEARELENFGANRALEKGVDLSVYIVQLREKLSIEKAAETGVKKMVSQQVSSIHCMRNTQFNVHL